MTNPPPLKLSVRFYQTEGGAEPVREWLQEQTKEVRTLVGTDIKTVQIGWPLGMPLVRKMDTDLWEVRTNFSDGIARVLFTVEGSDMILLHGFIKKSEKTPKSDLDLAKKRKAKLKGKR